MLSLPCGPFLEITVDKYVTLHIDFMCTDAILSRNFGAAMPAQPVLVSALPAVLQPEPFVDPDTAAAFVGITRRALLQKVRAGKLPGYPLDRGAKKKQCR